MLSKGTENRHEKEDQRAELVRKPKKKLSEYKSICTRDVTDMVKALAELVPANASQMVGKINDYLFDS